MRITSFTLTLKQLTNNHISFTLGMHGIPEPSPLLETQNKVECVRSCSTSQNNWSTKIHQNFPCQIAYHRQFTKKLKKICAVWLLISKSGTSYCISFSAAYPICHRKIHCLYHIVKYKFCMSAKVQSTWKLLSMHISQLS